MSSNLREKSIEGGGEQDEAKESFRDLFVASADESEAFETCVGVFDSVAVSIEFGVELVAPAATGLEGHVCEHAAGGQHGAKLDGIEGTISLQPVPSAIRATDRRRPSSRVGWELRKVEVFADGRMDFADKADQTGSTELGLAPIPSIESIAADPQFAPRVITRDEFESSWAKAKPQ